MRNALYGKTHGLIQTFNDQPNLHLPVNYNIDWMKDLPDNKLLSDITMPGTHDTVALHGGQAAECQSWALEDQLTAGIRYLDLRILAFGNNLNLMHGIIYQKMTFKDALGIIRKFLSSNPSETVLIRIKPELFNKGKVQEKVVNVIENSVKVWEKIPDTPIVWLKSTMPRLGEVRGKVVFVQKNKFKLGITLTQTNTAGDYKVTDIEKKKNVTNTNLDKAIGKCGGSSAILTYSSGTGFGTLKGALITPKKVAEELNPWLYNYLQDHFNRKPRPCFGVIAMDFPGIDLIQKVISFNNL
ncbi:hypothetical protein NFI96_003371 [Prochilodus magdalenae]|nr:hypothetical protein NFI96_003371 [Prochilodus magdalenae]